MNETKNSSGGDPQVIVPYGYIPYPPPEEDEIDLRNLWEVLKKRRWLILFTAAAALMASFAYILLAKPLYKAEATLEIGKELVSLKDGSLRTKYFDEAKRLKQNIDIKYDTKGEYREKGVSAYIERVVIPKKSEGFITIVSYGENNDAAMNKLKEPIGEIMDTHRIYYNSLLEKKKDTIRQLQHQVDYNLDTILPSLKTSLELLRTIELGKIDKQLGLIRSIDLKKIDEKIDWIEKEKIPTIEKKLSETESEIVKKEKTIATMRRQISKVAHSDPALAAMSAMQMANLQNDVSRLKMQLIDYRSQIKKLKEETIPDLQREKKRIMETTIPSLEAKKVRLEKEEIPAKISAIKKIENITIPQLKTRIKQIGTSMHEPYLVMTKVLGEIYTQERPVKPKKGVILAIALVSGLLLGVFLAFFLEFITKRAEDETP